MEQQLTTNAAVDLPYTSCYCEENTYHILTSLAQGRADSTECYAVFVSNEFKQVDPPYPFNVLHLVLQGLAPCVLLLTKTTHKNAALVNAL